MLTFSHTNGAMLQCSGGAMPIVLFPEKAVPGSIALIASPQEFPSREIVSWPGEYDIAGITIRGIGHEEGQKVSYVFTVDGVRIACPALPLEPWGDHDIEQLGDVHVLVLSAEDPKLCQKMLDDVDPRVLLIVPAADGSMNAEMLKACGAADKEHVSEWKLKGSLPQEGREVVVFG